MRWGLWRWYRGCRGDMGGVGVIWGLQGWYRGCGGDMGLQGWYGGCGGDNAVGRDDNAGGRANMLQPISFRCAGVWITTGLAVYLYRLTFHHMYTQYWFAPDLPHHNCCVNWGMLEQGRFKSQQLYNVFQNISLVALKSTDLNCFWKIIVLQRKTGCVLIQETYLLLVLCPLLQIPHRRL